MASDTVHMLGHVERVDRYLRTASLIVMVPIAIGLDLIVISVDVIVGSVGLIVISVVRWLASVVHWFTKPDPLRTRLVRRATRKRLKFKGLFVAWFLTYLIYPG